jgi:hypothetical protein
MKQNSKILIRKIKNTISNNDNESLESAINELKLVEMDTEYVPILNQLLLNKNHKKHHSLSPKVFKI